MEHSTQDPVFLISSTTTTHENIYTLYRFAKRDIDWWMMMMIKNWNLSVYLWRMIGRIKRSSLETELVHDPIGFSTTRSSTLIEDQCLPHPNKLTLSLNGSVFASGFPISGGRCSVCSQPRSVFPISLAVEIPIFPSHTCHFWSFQTYSKSFLIKYVNKIFCSLAAKT